jgi:hypothetical protein
MRRRSSALRSSSGTARTSLPSRNIKSNRLAIPTFSLEELGILLCDIVGPWTVDVAGFRPRSAEEAIAAIVAELPTEIPRPSPGTPEPRV